jgi:hypothetical protein
MTTDTTSRHVPGAASSESHHGADALEVLREDHAQARALADECRRFARSVAPERDIQQVAETLCRVLRMLSEVEEDLFYPAARAALSPQALALARLEHATAEAIIRQLQLTDPGEARYEALLVALSDCVERHVQHEQSELFPCVRAAHLDLDSLGERMSERQDELRAHH